MTSSDDTITVEFPGKPHGPIRNILLRLAIALGLILSVALLDDRVVYLRSHRR